MEITLFHKGKNNSIKRITKKLAVQDYVIEIENKDLYNAEVTYYFDKDEVIRYENGKKEVPTEKEYICIEVTGEDNSKKQGGFSIDLHLNKNELNKYTEIPTEISKYFDDGEFFIKFPEGGKSGPIHCDLPTNTKNDIYKNLSSVLISKEKKNVFIIKICCPELFTFFKLDLNEE